MNKFAFCLLILFFVIPYAFAFGVTPARTNFDYSPGTQFTGSFDVVNTEKEPLNLVILIQGELNKSISVSQASLKLSPNEDSAHIEYSVSVPAGLSPGDHFGEIVILQIPESTNSGQTYVGAVVGVVTQVAIFVPYPGKYIESDLSISDSAGVISFVMPLLSKGQLDVARAKAVIDIYTPLNEKVASLATNEVGVLSGTRKEVAVTWSTEDVTPGRYRAEATLIYDESTSNFEKEFSVGSQLLELKHVEVNDFTLGEIAKFEFLVENTWSEIIKDAYVQMQIFNRDGAVLADFKSATYDVPQFESKLLVAFWDTEGVKAGPYDATALLRFGEQSIRHDLELEVSDDDITVVGVGYVISSKKSGGSGSLTIILITAIAVLVIINLLWFLVLRKKFKSSGK